MSRTMTSGWAVTSMHREMQLRRSAQSGTRSRSKHMSDAAPQLSTAGNTVVGHARQRNGFPTCGINILLLSAPVVGELVTTLQKLAFTHACSTIVSFACPGQVRLFVPAFCSCRPIGSPPKTSPPLRGASLSPTHAAPNINTNLLSPQHVTTAAGTSLRTPLNPLVGKPHFTFAMSCPSHPPVPAPLGILAPATDTPPALLPFPIFT